MPSSRQIAEDPVQRLAGALVDAARRVVEQQHARAEREPAREQHLLLIAARKCSDGAVGRGRDDRQARADRSRSAPVCLRRSIRPKRRSRSSETRPKLSRIERDGKNPVGCGGRAPDRRRRVAPPVGSSRRGRPSPRLTTMTRPDADGCRPHKASRNASCPWPSSPARPTISPARTSPSKARRAARAPAPHQQPLRGALGLVKAMRRSLRPPQAPSGRASASGDSDARSSVSTTRPLRRMVTRSARRITSSMRWEMNRMRPPAAREALHSLKYGFAIGEIERRRDLVQDQDARPPTSARARTTSCCAASGRRPAGASRSNVVVAIEAQQSPPQAPRRCARGTRAAGSAVAAEKNVVQRASIGRDQHFLKDRRQAERLETPPERNARSVGRRRGSRRELGGTTPDRSLTSVLLPEPFSPRIA